MKRSELQEIMYDNTGGTYHRWISGPSKDSSFARSNGTVKERKASIRLIARTLKTVIKELALPGGSVGLIGASTSDALIVPSVADRLDLPFVMMRSRGATTSSGCDRDANEMVGLRAPNLIFVDDLIDGGNTFDRVNRGVLATQPSYEPEPESSPYRTLGAKLVGVVLTLEGYRNMENYWAQRTDPNPKYPTSYCTYKSVPLWFVGL